MSWPARIIFALIVLVMLSVAAVDLAFHVLKVSPVGERLHAWSRRYPVYASVVAALLGALLGHFFWP